jgi:hypothetical protein
LEEHDLDLAVVNGALKAGALALSFAQENKQHLKRDIDAAAFAIEDVRKMDRRTPLFVLAYSEGADPAEVTRASQLFANWNVRVVTEQAIGNWSREIVRGLPEDVLHA